MFERLQALFQSLTDQKSSEAFSGDDPRVSVAALCMQVMEADGVVLDSERDKLRTLLKETYQLDDSELAALLKAGQLIENQAVDYYRFTSDLKRHLNEEQRRQLVGILWDIVYADGTRSEIEDHVVWRIADLLGVSGRDRVHERLDAAARAQASDNSD